MTTLTAVRKPEHMEIDPFALRRFSVAEYHKMIKTGILKPDDRVELLEGWIVNKMPQNPPHSSSVTRANRRLARILPDRWTLRVQAPITLNNSEPEPDIVLARGAVEFYDHRHPRPTDIGVLMEFGDSTLLEDRLYKGVLYAQERIAEFWLINLVQRKIEVYTKPRGGKYHQKVEYTEKESVPLVLDRLKVADIPVAELLAKP
jgi:hypothetical protein